MKAKMGITCICIVGLLISAIWFARSGGTARKDTLVVGMMSGWAPFMTINTQGKYEGFDVDIAQRIADTMGKKLVIKDFGSLAPTFIALEQDSIDMVMSGLDITNARRERLNMIPYTGSEVNSFTLLFWQEIPISLNSTEKLAAARAIVCVEPGSAQEKFLDSVSGIAQKSLGKVEEMVLDLQYGKSQAMLVEPQVGRRLMKLVPKLKALSIPLPSNFVVYGFGIALSKKRPHLSQSVATIVEQLRTDGSLQLLEKKWNLEESV